MYEHMNAFEGVIACLNRHILQIKPQAIDGGEVYWEILEEILTEIEHDLEALRELRPHTKTGLHNPHQLR